MKNAQGRIVRAMAPPQIGGGEFSLLDQDESVAIRISGHFSLIYFGFSHCPGYRPDELDKLGCWLDALKCKMRDEIRLSSSRVIPTETDPRSLRSTSDFDPGMLVLRVPMRRLRKFANSTESLLLP